MCLLMGKIIRSNIDFLYVKGNRLSAHKLPIIRPPTGIYYLTYNITFRQLVSGCLGNMFKFKIYLNVYVGFVLRGFLFHSLLFFQMLENYYLFESYKICIRYIKPLQQLLYVYMFTINRGHHYSRYINKYNCI